MATVALSPPSHPLPRPWSRESAWERRSRAGPMTRLDRMTTADLGTILSVWAHPDDETYLAAGVMAAAADRGQRVVCVSATAGEHGTSDPADLAAARLGQRAPLGGGRGDGRARRQRAPHPRAARRRPRRARRRRAAPRSAGCSTRSEPDTILTFGPDGMTFHPDHIAVSPLGRPRRGSSAAAAAACCTPPSTVEHLARFGELYEEWGIVHDRRAPVRRARRRARRARRARRMRSSTASSPPSRRWPPRPPTRRATWVRRPTPHWWPRRRSWTHPRPAAAARTAGTGGRCRGTS